jgi:HEAT repeat protein
MKGIMPKPRAGGGGIVNTWDKYKDEDLPTIIEKIRADPQDYAAVQALQRFGTNAAPALPVLVELLESKKAQYPGNVVGAIAGLGPSASNAVPVLIRFLDDDDHGVVHNALNSFGRIGPSAIAAKPRLIEFLHDPSPVLCWVAANSLRRVDPAEKDLYLPVLLDPIKTDRYAEHFAEYQVRTLSELGDDVKPYIPKLRQMLAQREPVRIAAAEVLMTIDPSSTAEVVKAMIRTVEDETAMNPQLAAIVLGKVGPPAKDALPSLRKLAAHESEWKAKSAQDAINQIEQKAL